MNGMQFTASTRYVTMSLKTNNSHQITSFFAY